MLGLGMLGLGRRRWRHLGLDRWQLGTIHAAQDQFCTTGQVGRTGILVIKPRARQHDGEPRCLAWPQAGGAAAIVVLRRGLGTEDPITPLDHVEVNLENTALVHQEFKHVGDDEFLSFTEVTTLAGKEQILGQLLGDGGPAGDDFALLGIFFVGFLQRIPIDPFMFGEVGILGGNDRAFQMIGNTIVRHPLKL